MRGLIKLTWTELKLLLREPTAVFLSCLLPVVIVFVYGAMFGNWPISRGLGTVDLLVPGLLVTIVAHSGLVGMAGVVTSYRESGILRRLRTTPIQPQAIVTAEVIAMNLVLLIGLVTLLAAGRFLVHLRWIGSLWNIGAGFLLCSMTFFTMGMVVAGLVRTPRTAHALATLLFLPMMLVSGAMTTRSMMPASVQRVAELFPMTHAVDLLQGLWAGGSWTNHLLQLEMLLGVSIASLVVSWLTFRWD